MAVGHRVEKFKYLKRVMRSTSCFGSRVGHSRSTDRTALPPVTAVMPNPSSGRHFENFKLPYVRNSYPIHLMYKLSLLYTVTCKVNDIDRPAQRYDRLAHSQLTIAIRLRFDYDESDQN